MIKPDKAPFLNGFNSPSATEARKEEIEIENDCGLKLIHIYEKKTEE